MGSGVVVVAVALRVKSSVPIIKLFSSKDSCMFPDLSISTLSTNKRCLWQWWRKPLLSWKQNENTIPRFFLVVLGSLVNFSCAQKMREHILCFPRSTGLRVGPFWDSIPCFSCLAKQIICLARHRMYTESVWQNTSSWSSELRSLPYRTNAIDLL